MNYLNLISIISVLSAFLVRINASESGEFLELAIEKARIKANLEEIKVKPTPGQVIISVPIKPTQTEVVEQPEIHQLATTTPKPKKKDEKVVEESVDEEPKKNEDGKKKNIDNKKKSSGSSGSGDSNDHKKSKDDGSTELPKRLFRPRFRAESSAESISSSSILITLCISLFGLLFI